MYAPDRVHTEDNTMTTKVRARYRRGYCDASGSGAGHVFLSASFQLLLCSDLVRVWFASRDFICACLGSGLLLSLSRDEGSPEAAVWAERLAARGGVGLAPARVEGTPAVGHHLGAERVRLGRHLRSEVDLLERVVTQVVQAARRAVASVE